MSFWAETFSFNGTSCSDFDLMLYDIDGGGSEESEFASTVTIVEDNVSGRWRPLFYGTKYQNKLTFEIIFGVNECRIDREEYLSRDEIDSIATWLTGHEEYHWLAIDQEDMADIRYKCMITGLQLVSFGKVPWALKATITCDSPFAYRMPVETSYNVSGSGQISINNLSSLNGYYYPKIEFVRSSGTSFSIENVSDNGRTFSINNIPSAVTTINVDNDACVISNNQDLNLYGGCNYRWLRLKKGENVLNVTGYGTLKIKCEFPINVGG